MPHRPSPLSTEGELRPRLPPGQQLVARDKWPLVGERTSLPPEGPWIVQVAGQVRSPRMFRLEELAELPQTRLVTDIHCVTRWSKYDVEFGGVLLADLLRLTGTRPEARFVSMIARTERKHSSSLPLDRALSLGTLLATSCDGKPLPTEHGGPVRSVVPARYFYKSVKWVERIELLTDDQPGYWESQAGYHHGADPWLEQRYIAARIDRREAARLIESRDFSGRDLLSLEAGDRDLRGLRASDALLRNANFSRSDLREADFRNANLSNASFRFAELADASLAGADLEGADFAAANLRGADLRGSSLFGASFGDADESGQGIVLGAQIDGTTRIDRESLERLTPAQQAYILRALGK